MLMTTFSASSGYFSLPKCLLSALKPNTIGGRRVLDLQVSGEEDVAVVIWPAVELAAVPEGAWIAGDLVSFLLKWGAPTTGK
jgi:hypothetical protein